MADISMCQRKDCPLRYKCYRFMATPDPYWQSYLVIKKVGKDCRYFIYFKKKETRGGEAMKFIKYEHHGKEVWVRKDLKGKHREHCLCWQCAKFFPDDRERNCLIASLNFAMDRAFNITTPVFECPDFLETKSNNKQKEAKR